jgi:torulene dioxygenase
MNLPEVGELPMFHPDYRLKGLRYLGTVVDRGHSTLFDGLCKIDLESETRTCWENPWGHTPGEAIFIPNPNGSGEDDGVLLSVVLDGFQGKSYLLCLDARDMTELGRVQCDSVVGHGFHGCHVNTTVYSVEL